MLSLRAYGAARDIARLAGSASGEEGMKARRIGLLASRSLGEAGNPRPILRDLKAHPDLDPVARGWLYYDLAVVLSLGPVENRFMDALDTARDLGGKSPTLRTACDIWAATYHFHKEDFAAAADALRRGLRGLEEQRAVVRSLAVRLRLSLLEWAIGERQRARTDIERLESIATDLGDDGMASEAAFNGWMFDLREQADAPLPDRLRVADEPFHLYARLLHRTDGVSISDRMDRRHLAEVALTAALRATNDHERRAWHATVRSCLTDLGHEDRLRLQYCLR
jgi:hypothetical protein